MKTSEEIDHVLAYKKAGWSKRKIAAELGISRNTVTSISRRRDRPSQIPCLCFLFVLAAMAVRCGIGSLTPVVVFPNFFHWNFVTSLYEPSAQLQNTPLLAHQSVSELMTTGVRRN
jgi:transcriptional regulator with XRE-family HTH domain